MSDKPQPPPQTPAKPRPLPTQMPEAPPPKRIYEDVNRPGKRKPLNEDDK